MPTDQLVGWDSPLKQPLPMILEKLLYHRCEASRFDKVYQQCNDHQWLTFHDDRQLINNKISIKKKIKLNFGGKTYKYYLRRVGILSPL